MKIALLSDSIYPYNKGGKETRSYQLVNELAKKGHDIHFYTMKFWSGENIIVKDNITYHGICKNYPLYNGERRSIKQGLIFGFASFKLFFEKFDVLDADHMVYFHLFPARLACWFKRKKLIITWHEAWGKKYWIKYMGKKGIFGYLLEKISAIIADKIIAVSENTKNDLNKILNVPKSKISVIPNALKIKEIEKIKVSNEKSDIIFAGRLISHKNVDILIKAMDYIPDRQLFILGDGVEMTSLKKLVSKLGLKNITFKGFMENHDDVLSLMKSSKVFVIPSSREGFGISIIEANACNLPVITVNEPSNAGKNLIQNDKNGYVCQLNEKELANSIKKALNKKDWDCKQYVYKYDWNSIIKNFEEVYGVQ